MEKLTMIKRLAIAAIALGLAAAPAHAAFCTDHRGFVGDLGDDFWDYGYSEDEINDLDLIALRQGGVDATRVERWNGCIRAFVRLPSGGEEMQFFDPNTFRRIQ